MGIIGIQTHGQFLQPGLSFEKRLIQLPLRIFFQKIFAG